MRNIIDSNFPNFNDAGGYGSKLSQGRSSLIKREFHKTIEILLQLFRSQGIYLTSLYSSIK